jgi:hypothetical protein
VNEAIRLQDPNVIDRSQIQKILVNGDDPTIQFSRPGYTAGLLEQLNAACSEFGAKLEVRFFAHGPSFDAKWLDHLPDVASLSVDCLPSATNLDTLFNLRRLRKLSLGIYNLNQPDVLDRFHLKEVRELFVCETRKSNIDLSPLKKCHALRKLHVAGHTRSFGTLAELDTVSDLSLRSIPKKQSLAAVSGMRGLRTLMIVLGGRANIDNIAHPGLRRLEVIWVRGLTSVGSLARFPSLRHLRVEDQIRLEAINLTEAPTSLRHLRIFNCKNLRDLGSIAHLHELFELFISCTSVDFEMLVPTLPRSLRYVCLRTGRTKTDAPTRARLDAMGYREFLHVDNPDAAEQEEEES